jgi:GNAT superfamily N-acetyltransferase
MPRSWIRESPALWDPDKAAIFGAAPEGALRLPRYAPGALLPGEWWRVEDAGRIVAYGWMELSWGDGEILLAVHPEHRRRGIGAFILEELSREAAQAGLNYVHNTVEPTHPQGEEVGLWLKRHGFTDAGDGRLRRRARA